MAFSITLGVTSDNKNKVDKTYTTLSPQGGVLIDPTSKIDLINPVFLINYDAAYLTCNYVEASFLGRKYFAKVSVETGKQMIITCSVDVLSSFSLGNCKITVLRNGDLGAPTKIQDSKYPILTSEETIDQVPISNADLQVPIGYASRYVLQVIGGSTL